MWSIDFSQTMMGEMCRGRRLDPPEARVVGGAVEAGEVDGAAEMEEEQPPSQGDEEIE